MGALAKQFSAMAMVNTIAEKTLALLNQYDDEGKLIGELKAMQKDIFKINELVVWQCRELFRKKTTVITYSNSGLVRKVIGRYHKKIRHLCLSEACPAREGKVAAAYYANLGIPVTICADVLLPSFLSEADLLLLGADQIGSDYFINKIGSAALLQLADSAGSRRVVVFESLKIRPDDMESEVLREYPRREIWKGRIPENLMVRNPYFERIPLSLTDLCICELGIDTPQTLMRKLKTGR